LPVPVTLVTFVNYGTVLHYRFSYCGFLNTVHLPCVHRPRKPVAHCVMIYYSALLVDSVPTAMSLNILRHDEEQQENSTGIGKQCQFPANLGTGQ